VCGYYFVVFVYVATIKLEYGDGNLNGTETRGILLYPPLIRIATSLKGEFLLLVF
jgi:hypothetical protein